jgi:serine/threonine-protein kinase
MAQPFDVDRLEFTGAPRPVAEQVTTIPNGMGFFDVSETGRLTYLTGGELRARMTPVWVDRNGGARDVEAGWSVGGDRFNSSLSLSPDGTRLAISILGPEATYDLWVKQLDTSSRSQLTFEGQSNFGPHWSPDGQSLTFVSNRAGQSDLWRKRADGTGTAELVLDGDRVVTEGFLSPDGWLVFRDGGSGGLRSGDIFAKRPETDSVPIPLVVTEGGQYAATLSPDGRWLAYVSNETGREEVYVRPFPDTDSGRWLVSTSGGAEPVWAHSGRELFYRNGANELVAVQVSGDPTFAAGQQEVLFSMAGYLQGADYQMYDVSPDDQEFVMLRINDESAATELILVENWAEEFRQRTGN